MKTTIIALALSLPFTGCGSNPKPAANQHPETDTQTVEVVSVASQKLTTVFTLPAQLFHSRSWRSIQKLLASWI